jgi:hypothetical protein
VGLVFWTLVNLGSTELCNYVFSSKKICIPQPKKIRVESLFMISLLADNCSLILLMPGRLLPSWCPHVDWLLVEIVNGGT